MARRDRSQALVTALWRAGVLSTSTAKAVALELADEHRKDAARRRGRRQLRKAA